MILLVPGTRADENGVTHRKGHNPDTRDHGMPMGRAQLAFARPHMRHAKEFL